MSDREHVTRWLHNLTELVEHDLPESQHAVERLRHAEQYAQLAPDQDVVVLGALIEHGLSGAGATLVGRWATGDVDVRGLFSALVAIELGHHIDTAITTTLAPSIDPHGGGHH